jgi:hypothetical protein
MDLVKHSLALAVMAATFLNPAHASENPGAHVHGQASMQVASEGKRIDVIFKTPAANLVGFEYEPKTGAEQKAVAEARKWLTETPLVNTAASACRVEQATVNTTHDKNNHNEHGDHHGHDDHHEDHKGEGHHEDEEHDHQAEETDSHSEFEVSQHLVCNGVPGENLMTPLLTRYPSINSLSIDWVTENNQGGTRLEAGSTEFRLSR